jgi:hypothetical protein
MRILALCVGAIFLILIVVLRPAWATGFMDNRIFALILFWVGFSMGREMPKKL